MIADFEGDGHVGWIASGTAFDPGIRTNRANGFPGKGFINTCLEQDKSTGTLTSPVSPSNVSISTFSSAVANTPRKRECGC